MEKIQSGKVPREITERIKAEYRENTIPIMREYQTWRERSKRERGIYIS